MHCDTRIGVVQRISASCNTVLQRTNTGLEYGSAGEVAAPWSWPVHCIRWSVLAGPYVIPTRMTYVSNNLGVSPYIWARIFVRLKFGTRCLWCGASVIGTTVNRDGNSRSCVVNLWSMLLACCLLLCCGSRYMATDPKITQSNAGCWLLAATMRGPTLRQPAQAALTTIQPETPPRLGSVAPGGTTVGDV